MTNSDEIRHRARTALWPIIGALLLAYFSFHMVQGQQGILSFLQLQSKVENAEMLSVSLGDERRELEARVRLLSPDNLDPDMIEERARIMLNYGHQNEIVILDSEPSRNIR